jgi:hypothetical protein
MLERAGYEVSLRDQALRMLTTECGRRSPEITTFPTLSPSRYAADEACPAGHSSPTVFAGIGGQTPLLLRFLDAYLQNPEGPSPFFATWSDRCNNAPGDRRSQREVAVNTPGLRPAASETGSRSNQPYPYIAEGERFYRKTRVFCMQVNPATDTTTPVGAVQ